MVRTNGSRDRVTLAIARVSAWTSLVLAFWGALGIVLFAFGAIGGATAAIGALVLGPLSLRAGATGRPSRGEDG